MQLWSIDGNSQRLDGGAMFGNVPKALWTRWIEPDDRNRIPLSCRALLVREDDGRLLLFETGIGTFFEPKLRDRFGVLEDRHVLLENLEDAGFSHTDIDVVVLSHLHFDHAGGLLTGWTEGAQSDLLFDNATYLVGQRAWQRACNPHPRDRASFIPRLQQLLEASGRLAIADGPTSDVLGSGYRLHYSDGHTPGLMLTEIAASSGPILFCGDLVPGSPWVHLPITMGYDRFAELLIDEKTKLLGDLIGRGARLFFTHDPTVAMAELRRDDRGRFKAGRAWPSFANLAA